MREFRRIAHGINRVEKYIKDMPIETDVQLSADKIPVMVHDKVINYHHKKVKIKKTRYQELEKAGIEPLEKLLRVADRIVIDLKGGGNMSSLTTLIRKKYGKNVREHVMVSGYRLAEMMVLHRTTGCDILLSYNFGKLLMFFVLLLAPFLKLIGVSGFSIREKYAIKSILYLLKLLGFKIFLWEIKDQKAYLLEKEGLVDGMFIDLPSNVKDKKNIRIS